LIYVLEFPKIFFYLSCVLSEEINAGFHEATNLVRERLDLRDQLQVFEPTILESDPQVSIPYDPLGPFPGASTTLGIVSDMSYALGLLPV